MALSTKTKNILEKALANRTAKNEVVSAMDAATAAVLVATGSHKIVAVVIATAASTTTDFVGKLTVGDLVLKVPTTPGAVTAGIVATLDTAPVTPVIGDAMVVIRAV